MSEKILSKEDWISWFLLDDHYGDAMPGRKWHHCWVGVFDITTSLCVNCAEDWFKCACIPVNVGHGKHGPIHGYSNR